LKNTRSSRCKDNEINLKSNLPRYVADANYLFREKPLTVDETVSSEIKEGPKVVHYWKSAQAIRFQHEFRVLRTMQPEKLEDEWAAKVGAFAEKLDDWQPSDNETESEVFNQKCVLYRILLGLSADEPLKKNIFRRFLR